MPAVLKKHLLVLVDNAMYALWNGLHFLVVEPDFRRNGLHVLIVEIDFVTKPLDGSLVRFKVDV